MEPSENDRLLGAGIASESCENVQRSEGFQLKYTLEIPMFLTLFGLSLSVEDCKSFLEPETINHTQELEKEVQKYVTLVNTTTSVSEALVPAVLSLFLGVWSDKHGRKPLIVWTLLGSAVSLFGSVFGPLTRSFLSKTLPSQDIAKAFGLLMFAKSFCPLLSPLVYNALYEFTISDFAGAFLVVTAAAYAMAFVLILIVKCLIARRPAELYQPTDSAIN